MDIYNPYLRADFPKSLSSIHKSVWQDKKEVSAAGRTYKKVRERITRLYLSLFTATMSQELVGRRVGLEAGNRSLVYVSVGPAIVWTQKRARDFSQPHVQLMWRVRTHKENGGRGQGAVPPSPVEINTTSPTCLGIRHFFKYLFLRKKNLCGWKEKK